MRGQLTEVRIYNLIQLIQNELNQLLYIAKIKFKLKNKAALLWLTFPFIILGNMLKRVFKTYKISFFNTIYFIKFYFSCHFLLGKILIKIKEKFCNLKKNFFYLKKCMKFDWIVCLHFSFSKKLNVNFWLWFCFFQSWKINSNLNLRILQFT